MTGGGAGEDELSAECTATAGSSAHPLDAAVLCEQVCVHQVHHGGGGALQHSLQHVGAQQPGVQVITAWRAAQAWTNICMWAQRMAGEADRGQRAGLAGPRAGTLRTGAGFWFGWNTK
ncbi:hypothetical protein HaLaN_08472 [Haematococcus lacustris]|uniref:Uncharacterized protein n=1 Tax=Haematococcus lacustris TaxID=44745 RepID=A0A699YSC2_HAELA|nr:hypothetical protein HaLaN_08472 [Haematococcus lacustris]